MKKNERTKKQTSSPCHPEAKIGSFFCGCKVCRGYHKIMRPNWANYFCMECHRIVLTIPGCIKWKTGQKIRSDIKFEPYWGREIHGLSTEFILVWPRRRRR